MRRAGALRAFSSLLQERLATSATRTTSYGGCRWSAPCRQSISHVRTAVRPSQPPSAAPPLAVASPFAQIASAGSAAASAIRSAVGGRLASTFSRSRSMHSSMSVITTCGTDCCVLKQNFRGQQSSSHLILDTSIRHGKIDWKAGPTSRKHARCVATMPGMPVAPAPSSMHLVPCQR